MRCVLAAMGLLLAVAGTACLGGPQPEPPTHGPEDAGAGARHDAAPPWADGGARDAGGRADGGVSTDGGPPPGPVVAPPPRLPPRLEPPGPSPLPWPRPGPPDAGGA